MVLQEIGRYTVQYEVVAAGDYLLFIELEAREVGWVNITSRSPELPTTLRFLPGDISSGACTAVSELGALVQTIVAGEEENILLYARDAQHNAVVDSSAASKFGLELTDGPVAWSTGRDDSLGNTVLPDDGDHYEVAYTINIKGEYSLTINYQIYGIADSPFLIVVQPAELDPTTSRATGAARTRAPVGDESTPNTFDIQCKDRFTNNLEGECPGEPVVRLTKGSDVWTGSTTAADGGTFVGSYHTDQTGQYAITVTLNNIQVSGSPFQCTLDPGAPDVGRCSASGTADQIRASIGSSQGSVQVRLRDQFNNDCAGGYNIDVDIVDSIGVGTMITSATAIPESVSESHWILVGGVLRVVSNPRNPR